MTRGTKIGLGILGGAVVLGLCCTGIGFFFAPQIAVAAASVLGTGAVASTGTPIAILTGAAAESAALALFGGGSLAAGGAGMAGGVTVITTGLGVTGAGLGAAGAGIGATVASSDC